MKPFRLFIIITAVFLLSHGIGFAHAPWNTYGLFDDAAWDIYFALTHIGQGLPIQAAYFDSVGQISREVVFHYYITALFTVFGYNLLIFNLGLMFLGYITVMGCTMIAQRLFKNIWISFSIGLIINFWPLQYMHIFMGHRYAISVPLLVVSLYFLYSGLLQSSKIRVIISALFAALCLASSVMGKQYIYALALGFFCTMATGYGRQQILKSRNLILMWAGSFLLAATPILTYIIRNPELYSIRESGLIRDFVAAYQTQGMHGLTPYTNALKEIFFSAYSGRRQFLGGYPVIPFAYYALIVPGLIIAWLRRRREIVFLSLIPVFASYVAGAFDFRVLLAVPAWVIAMGYTFDAVAHISRIRIQRFAIAGLCVMSLCGFAPSVTYISRMVLNPNGQYLLPHKDVAVSRMVQDIAAGAEHPSQGMKWNEFKRQPDRSMPYDLLVAPASAFAIMHLFLQPYDDKRILSFANGGIQNLMTADELYGYNRTAVLDVIPSGKDLKLVWEVTSKSKPVVDAFVRFAPYAKTETIADVIDGNAYSLFIMTIQPADIKGIQAILRNTPVLL